MSLRRVLLVGPVGVLGGAERVMLDAVRALRHERPGLALKVIAMTPGPLLHEARTAGVHGAAVTPFLLAAVERATEGRSLAANLALLEANAGLAAAIAVALAEIGARRV